MSTERYELRPVGVFDRELGRVIGRGDSAWPLYQAWIAEGNVPGPQSVPSRPIEARRADMLAAINAKRISALASGVSFKGHRYDSDEGSRANVTAIVAAVSAGIRLPANLTWRTANNLDVPMDAVTISELGAAMVEHVDRCYRRSWELKRIVECADEPELVDIMAGWPE